MSYSIQSLQGAQAQEQTQKAVQPPPKPPTVAQAALPQDTVTISKAAQQAQTNNAKPTPTGDTDHDGGSK
jgi:hypothetical protein